ncbi:hypothetical protein FGO68_gene13667 [Halteria grandinella]|uniref:RRM domain-containing protein n=1 Tax=Halteria grandinella TaxID=5974 RepID=A0A8J8SX99_HALGN|nr:hypothetical protein FGO68_gene13667 [Halteria grandinella]
MTRGGSSNFAQSSSNDRSGQGGSFLAAMSQGHLSGQRSSLLGFVAKQEMPDHLSILFRARPPIGYAEPIPKGKCKPITSYFDGLRDYMSLFEQTEPPKPKAQEKANEKKERIKKEKITQHLVAQKEEVKKWNPYNDPHIKGDPFRTLFVSNLAYTTDEKALKESLQVYGRIRRIRIITDQKTQKPKGYAFVEFDNESDFQSKWKEGRWQENRCRLRTWPYKAGVGPQETRWGERRQAQRPRD